MRTMTMQVFLAVCALAVCSPILNTYGQEEPRMPDKTSDKELAELMKRKLENAQKVLEGIALNDFDGISKHADELILISKQAEWRVRKTARYETYSNEFRRSAAELVENAKQKNLDGAALAYVDLTLTCVKCHKDVRESRQSKLDK